MPPLPLEYQGRELAGEFLAATALRPGWTAGLKPARTTANGGQPALADVVRRNVVRVTATMIAGTRTPTLLITSAIDNLVKGAAGQALQNANLMFGFDECEGLPV